MMNAAQPYDRRAYPRLHVRGTVRLEHGGLYLSAPVENISLGGICLTLQTTLPVGVEVPLDISLPAGAELAVRGEVVRSYTGGAALRFHWTDANDPSRQRLQEELAA